MLYDEAGWLFARHPLFSFSISLSSRQVRLSINASSRGLTMFFFFLHAQGWMYTSWFLTIET